MDLTQRNSEIFKFQEVDFLKTDIESRRRLEELFVSYGMTSSTFYNRFLREKKEPRFDAWEMKGVVSCIRDFEQLHRLDPTDEEQLHAFYASLPMKTFFWPYMNEMGMGINSIINRFSVWNFKPWELIGVNRILEEFNKQ